MARGQVRFRAWLSLAALLSVALAAACDDVGGEVVGGPAASRGVRVIVKNESLAAFKLEGRTVRVGETGFYASHSDTDRPSASFEITRAGVGLARVSYRVLRFPEDSHDARIIVSESIAGAFQARTTDATWIEVLDVQLL